MLIYIRAFFFCLSQYDGFKWFCTERTLEDKELQEEIKKDFENDPFTKNKFVFAWHYAKTYVEAWKEK